METREEIRELVKNTVDELLNKIIKKTEGQGMTGTEAFLMLERLRQESSWERRSLDCEVYEKAKAELQERINNRMI